MPRKIIPVIFCAAAVFLFAFSAFAQTDDAPKKAALRLNFPQILGASYNDPSQELNIDIADYIGALYQYALSIVGLVAVAMIMFGGVVWLTAGGNASRVDQAKEMIGNAVVGLLIALFSYTLLQTINPALTRLEVPKIQTVERVEQSTVSEWCPDLQKFPCGAKTKDDSGKDCIGRWCSVQSQDCYNKNTKSVEAVVGSSYVCLDLKKCEFFEKAGGCSAIQGIEDVNKFCNSGLCYDFIGGCRSSLTTYQCFDAPEGSSCKEDKECKKGEICKSGGQCSPIGQTGDACESDRECVSGICNTDENECAPEKGELGGRPCDRDLECASKLCNKAWAFDKCTPVGGEPVGAECNRNEECASKKCKATGIILKDDGNCAE